LFISVVEFTVYLPDLLDSGGADQGVETHVIEPTEPIDVRRNRQLTLDNMRLNRELVIILFWERMSFGNFKLC
jgi:hypothetical protein